ncbi:MAG: DUF2934 domain-containing protein [Terracidiphilus sp.]|jgi:hypothetical protein
MIVSKVQKQPKVNKVVVVAPQNLPAKPAKTAASAPRVYASPDRIRERAFEIFEKRGSQPGHDLQDWFHAERQILAQ